MAHRLAFQKNIFNTFEVKNVFLLLDCEHGTASSHILPVYGGEPPAAPGLC